MDKTLKIFAHKGFVGAVCDLENGKFLNDLKDKNQIGVVVHVRDIEITTEALEVFKKSERVGGSFSSVMLTSHQGYSSEGSVALLSKSRNYLIGDSVEIGRTCDKRVLRWISINDEIEVPQGFKDVVEGNSDAGS